MKDGVLMHSRQQLWNTQQYVFQNIEYLLKTDSVGRLAST